MNHSYSRGQPTKPGACNGLLDDETKRRMTLSSPRYPLETPEEKRHREQFFFEIAQSLKSRHFSGILLETWVRGAVMPFLDSTVLPMGMPVYICADSLSDAYLVAVHYCWLHELLRKEDLGTSLLHASGKVLKAFTDQRAPTPSSGLTNYHSRARQQQQRPGFQQDQWRKRSLDGQPDSQGRCKVFKQTYGQRSQPSGAYRGPPHYSPSAPHLNRVFAQKPESSSHSGLSRQYYPPPSGTNWHGREASIISHPPSSNSSKASRDYLPNPRMDSHHHYPLSTLNHHRAVSPPHTHSSHATTSTSTPWKSDNNTPTTSFYDESNDSGDGLDKTDSREPRPRIVGPSRTSASITAKQAAGQDVSVDVASSSSALDARPTPPVLAPSTVVDMDTVVKKEQGEICLNSTLPSLQQYALEILSHSGPWTPKLDPTKPAETQKPLVRYPPIWSQTRQEVCESFEWFRSYQGGVYFVNDIAKGYLLSAFGAKRDAFHHQGKLIISHGGGKAESLHSVYGKYTLKEAEDQQANDKSVRALLRTYKEGRPIALVIDDRYPLFPLDLASKDVTYAVLGFYMITHTWAEFQGSGEGKSVVKYKFAFQWCEGQGEPWWTSPNGMPAMAGDSGNLEATRPVKVEEIRLDRARDGADDETSMKCKHCQEFSPQVYMISWACLNPTCVWFWRMKDSGMLMPEELTYQEDFLSLRKPTYLPIGYESLRPPLVTERSDGITTSAVFTRGFHCADCGRLSCRNDWRHWQCNTIGCDKVYRVAPRIHAANEFCFGPVPSSTKFDFEWIEKNCGLVRRPLRSFAIGTKGTIGQIQTIALPKGRGFLHHIRSNSPFCKDQANDLFHWYQKDANEGDLRFRRWPMRAHKCRGALLTNYFSHNAGVPYHYVGGTENTVPFDQAPESVVRARALIKSRISDALKKDVDFNEVLTAAYMEKQKMAFHSDDEKGLGPLVAGLSLGSPALMHFKLMKKYVKSGDHKQILASFILRHGDVLVMEGAEVQEYYEHTVIPTNFRIAATARFINPGLEHTQVKPLVSND